MTPATDTRPVQTFAMVRQRVDPKLSGFSPSTNVYLTAFVPVIAIDFYPKHTRKHTRIPTPTYPKPAPAASGIQPEETP